jgi:hypothetical protein
MAVGQLLYKAPDTGNHIPTEEIEGRLVLRTK